MMCVNQLNLLSRDVIGAAIEVHRFLGPGLLESVYQQSLCQELMARNIPFESQYPVPVKYRDLRLECGYRLDFLIARELVLEVKSVEALAPIHESQLLTYLRLGKWKIGLLINFNVTVLTAGIRRRVMGL